MGMALAATNTIPERNGARRVPAFPGQRSLVMIGLDFRTAPVALREKISFSADALPAALSALRSHPAIEEAFLLSTCNRTELYAVTDYADWRNLLCRELVRHGSASCEDVFSRLYWHTGACAARHLFRVAAGLESMVLGEAEIVHQIKLAANAAREQAAAGTIVHRLIDKALAASKKARTQACYDACGLSVAAIAVSACKRASDDLSTLSVMILGAGETAELTLHYLVNKGVRKVCIANRTYARAAQLAQLTGGEALSLHDFHQRLHDVDVVICCTSSPSPIITPELLAPQMRARENRPLLLVDIAVPRDVDPATAALPGVHLLDIDQLHGNMASEEARQEKLALADTIIEGEAAGYGDWLAQRAALAAGRSVFQPIVEH